MDIRVGFLEIDITMLETFLIIIKFESFMANNFFPH